MVKKRVVGIVCLLAMFAAGVMNVCAENAPLPDPDGKPADMSKPVQVFILLVVVLGTMGS